MRRSLPHLLPTAPAALILAALVAGAAGVPRRPRRRRRQRPIAGIPVRFTDSLGLSQRPGGETAAAALGWLRALRPDRPFFLFLGKTAPPPYVPQTRKPF